MSVSEHSQQRNRPTNEGKSYNDYAQSSLSPFNGGKRNNSFSNQSYLSTNAFYNQRQNNLNGQQNPSRSSTTFQTHHQQNESLSQDKQRMSLNQRSFYEKNGNQPNLKQTQSRSFYIPQHSQSFVETYKRDSNPIQNQMMPQRNSSALFQVIQPKQFKDVQEISHDNIQFQETRLPNRGASQSTRHSQSSANAQRLSSTFERIFNIRPQNKVETEQPHNFVRSASPYPVVKNKNGESNQFENVRRDHTPNHNSKIDQNPNLQRQSTSFYNDKTQPVNSQHFEPSKHIQADDVKSNQSQGSVAKSIQAQPLSQKNIRDDQSRKSVSDSESFISQQVCVTCVNKCLAEEKKVNDRKMKEQENLVDKQTREAIRAVLQKKQEDHLQHKQREKEMLINQFKEQIKLRDYAKLQEKETQIQSRVANNQKIQEQQDALYKQKMEDVKQIKEAYYQEIQQQIDYHNEKKRQDKEMEKNFADNVMKNQWCGDVKPSQSRLKSHHRQDLLTQMQQKEQIKSQNTKEDLQNVQKMLECKQKDDKLYFERLAEEKAAKIQQYKEYLGVQNQEKEFKKAQQLKEEDSFKQQQQNITNMTKNRDTQIIQYNENKKREAAISLKNQIEEKKKQEQQERQDELKYSSYLKQIQDQREAQQETTNANCDKCLSSFPQTYLSKQRVQKSKTKKI